MTRFSFALAAVVLLLAVFVVRGEEDAGGDGDVSGPSGTLAGYSPASDVEEHSKIDLDIRDIEQALQLDPPDYTASKNIYTEGKNSNRGTGFRAIQTFSTTYATDADFQTEPFAILGKNFWGDWDYGDKHLLSLFDGTDSAYGNYASGVLGQDHEARFQLIKKVIKFQVVLQYALHELEAAIKKYNDMSLTVAERYGIGGAVHALDEWWAFYTGTLESGTGNGFGPYIMAEKRAKNFGTGTCSVGNGGVACVNKELLDRTNNMKTLMQSEGNSAEILSDVKCVRAQLKVGAIQGCLEYSYKASIAAAADLPAWKAEAWAFCGTALPFLQEVDASAAATVKAETIFTSDAKPDWNKVKNAFSAANLNKMGLRCADIGAYTATVYDDTSIPASDHAVCTDTEAGPDNANGDVLDCPTVDGSSESGAAVTRGTMYTGVLAAALALLFA